MTFTIKGYTPYVNGIVGHDFRLSFLQRLKILFCGGISVILVEEKLRKEKDKEGTEKADSKCNILKL